MPICLQQPRPNGLLIFAHRNKPVLTCLGVVHPVYPPLLRYLQIVLEVEQEIGRWHRPASEEVLRHPPALKVVRCRSVCENVNE